MATKRTPPPPRKAKPVGPTASNDDLFEEEAEPTNRDVLNAISGLVSRVERLESGQVRYVEREPEPKPDQRAVDPDALDPFTRKLWEERTHDVPDNFGGDTEPNYNVPLRLYLKNDGTYAWLQGDAKNRAYYTEKGYYALSPDEVAAYEKVKPSILAETREKAHLIGAIRRLIDTDSALVGHRGDTDADNELNLMSVGQLHQAWQSLTAETSQPERPLPPLKRYRSEGRDPHMAGIDTTPPRSRVAEFEGEQERARPQRGGRTVEVTPSNARHFR